MPDFSRVRPANIDIAEVLPIFTENRVDVAFLTITATGFTKGLMDAIETFRDFLKRHRIHNYATQPKGQAAKVLRPCQIVTAAGLVETKVALYRPETKTGDPRLWVYGLKQYCKPTDLLAFTAKDDTLYVFNVSNAPLREALRTEGAFVRTFLQSFASPISTVAAELLAKLRAICSLGFIPGITHGSTNIGMTLEAQLGIAPNSLRTPDFKGIELKTGRMTKRPGGANRYTLFSKTPDWERSAMSATEILSRFGYFRKKDGIWSLACTVSNIPNQQGLFFKTIESDVHNLAKPKGQDTAFKVALWPIVQLEQALLAKHRETFWIGADVRMDGGREYFHYITATHTQSPNAHLFHTLIDAGIITMDYLLKRKPSGAVRDHGYLFKIFPRDFNLLFPPPRMYDLRDTI